MPDPAGSILLIGAGRMGYALLEGWLKEPALGGYRFQVAEPHPAGPLERLAKEGRIDLNPDPVDLDPALAVLAVKPQIMDEVAAPFRPLAQNGTPFLSIAAGRSIRSIKQALGADCPVVRAMPNTPASLGRGATVCVADGTIPDDLKTLCTTLLEAVGHVAWIEDESLIDAVTAVSGSGPAYVFHMAECLAAAGEKAGLPRNLAEELARLTVAGAGEMLWRGEADAATLRENVTSPGGTTAAALHILMAKDGLKPLMERAVDAAKQRGRELDRS